MCNNFTVFFQSWIWSIWLLLLFAVTGSVVLTGSFSDALFSLFLLPIFYGLIVFTNSKWQRCNPDNYVILLFVWAFIVRLLSIYIFSEVLTKYIGIPFLSMKDDFVYNQISSEIVEKWRNFGFGFYDEIQFSTGFYSGFPNFSAVLKYIFGDSLFIPRIGNAVLSALSCVTAYKICCSYAPQSESKLVGLIFLFSPLLITFASLQLKDTLLLFLILTAIHANVKILSGQVGIVIFLQFILSLFCMAFVRAASIVPIIGAYCLTIILSRRRNKFLMLLLAMGLIYCTYYSWEYISVSSGVDVENYFNTRYALMSSRTIEDTGAGIASTSLGKLIGAPIYILAGLFLPPPTIIELLNAETINFDMFGVVFHYSLLPFLCIAFFRSIKRRKEMIVPFYMALLFLLFKVGQANSVMSILSPRQSLATMYVMYLMLPLSLEDIGKNSIRIIILIFSILVMLGYAIVRLYSRGLI